ncbi:MAG: peptidoglycan recognition protein family protein [Kangiellaceae bacterium]|nr:peptidoglycan recognition protein family protein [Kangiellaceae bacterium]
MKRRKFITASGLTLCGIGAGALYWPNRWEYIVVHHSGGDFGNIDFLQKVHRERQQADPVDAIPYHYIIGNGNGMAMGQIASDWRQENNIWGAHVSGNNPDRNFRGLGICLIGNYEMTEIPNKQYSVLVSLTKQLMLKHGISVGNVTGHGYTSGEQTKCPGKNFPMESFLSDIKIKRS